MNRQTKFSPELRERAIRMVYEQREHHESQWAAIESVSDMEQPGHDIKLSSLKRYVEATGGKLRIDVELPDGSHFGFRV